jgi:anti-sigma regulatory factor (Ser/Thr protein kinase)
MRSNAKTLSLTFRAEPDSVSSARAALGDFARQAGAESRQVDAVRLASSEALTNAVLHAYRTEPGSVYVTAAVVAEELWVLVADDGCGLEPRAGRPGLGLGLGLIAQLSDELAIVPRARGGTEVRMRFNLVRTEPSGPRRSSDSESRESGGGPDAFRTRPSFA